eukprot:3312355-Pleurochrysis_carterae.AAC.1
MAATHPSMLYSDSSLHDDSALFFYRLVAARSGTSSGHCQIGWRVFRVVPGTLVHLEALKVTSKSVPSLFWAMRQAHY